MKANVQAYYTGTSGLLLPVPNKLHYPEEFQRGSRLRYYASLMNSIEINSSFYKIPQATTIAKWASDVPDGFKFTFKLFKEVSHSRRLFFDEKIVERFIQVIDAVEEKRGCLLVQFPPSVGLPQMSQLEKLMMLLRNLDMTMSWKIAFEFRHPSLYTEETYELLNRYRLGMVLHDKPPANTPMIEPHTDFVYLRLHGPEGSYRGSYTADLLAEYASYISEWLSSGKQVFVYFNNTMGEAYGNLMKLRYMIAEGRY